MSSVGRWSVVIGAWLLAAEAALAGPRIYIPLGATGRVEVIDTSGDEVSGVIGDVGNVHGLAIAPGGRYLVAGSLDEQAPGAAAGPPRPAGVSEVEHRKHHAVAAESGTASVGTSYVSIIDTVAEAVTRRVAVRGAVHHVAISPSGKLAVTTHPGVGGISVIDLDELEVVTTVATGSAPNYAVFSADGGKVYVSNSGENTLSEIDVGTWSVTRRIPTGRSPEHLVLAPDGETIFTNNVADGTASAISLADGRITRTFPVGSAPHGIDLSDDGTTLFATSQVDETVVAIDLSSGETRSIALSPAPYHLTAVQGTGMLYVSSRAQNRVWVIDQQTLARRAEVPIGGIGHQMAVSVRDL